MTAYGEDDLNEKIDDDIDVTDTDIKINPDFYIHNATVKAQAALINPDVKTGFLQFRILVDNLEGLISAAKRLPIDYDKIITAEDARLGNNQHKDIMLANFRFKILMAAAFDRKTINTKLPG